MAKRDLLVSPVSGTGNRNSNNNSRVFPRLSYDPAFRRHSVESYQYYAPDPSHIEGVRGVVASGHPLLTSEPKDLPSTSTSRPASRSTWGTRMIKNWRTSFIIIGFLIVAIISAAGHYWFLNALDGDIVDRGRLKQSHVNALSLLLLTVFKAAITACVGLCFAQHLWYLLRGAATPISLIEKLFVLQNNLFAIGDVRIVRRAPLLFAMALFGWCLGIATIYPPGALIITLEPYTFIETRNISVMNPPVPLDFNPFMEDEYLQYPRLSGRRGSPECSTDVSPGQPPFCMVEYYYRDSAQPLLNVAKSVVNNNPGFQSLSSTGENSSYQLTFRAPQFRCNTSSFNVTVLSSSTFTDLNVIQTMWNGTNFTFHHQHGVQYFTAEPDESPIDVEVIMETEDLVCHPYSVLYQVNITHPKGVQSFVHAMDDWQPLGYPERDNSGLLELYGMDFDTDDMNPWPWPESGRDMSSYPEEAKVFAQDAREMLPQFNEFAIVDSLMAQLQIDTADGVNPEACTQEFKLANGTNAFECSWDPNQRGSNNSDGDISHELEGTVFDLTRFDESNWSNVKYGENGTYITITEALLNEALTNITVSALSLGTWRRPTPVTFIHYQNTYRFSNRLYLILPYSISIGLAMVFSVVALWSLWRNGSAVTDGGFVQVMLATRGDTEMERLAVQEGCTSADNMSQELKQIKLRYGQLTVGQQGEADDVRMGFGTVDETISVKKRE